MAMTVETALLDSPIGRLTLTAEGGELTGLRMGADRLDEKPVKPRGLLAEAARQLAAYFAGDLKRFDLPIRVRGSVFDQKIWAALLDIPYGETWSYGELAARVGSPNGARPAGGSCGRNPVAIVVPCHRVVGRNGALGGYGGGIERRVWLLDHESRVVAGTDVTSLARTSGS
jgi:methylated-DNA-[protein]-cysteine S-methyltransferase